MFSFFFFLKKNLSKERKLTFFMYYISICFFIFEKKLLKIKISVIGIDKVKSSRTNGYNEETGRERERGRVRFKIGILLLLSPFSGICLKCTR